MLQIHWLDEIDSTQTYLKNAIRNKTLLPPCAVSAEIQTKGIGSRNNNWFSSKGNLFLSFALHVKSLPHDLKLESASIYFAYLLKEVLQKSGSEIYLKWPNDFYIKEQKVGGMITTLQEDILICGVGLNLVSAPEGFGVLDVVLNKKELLEQYFKKIEKKPLWKKVFSKYKLEFHLSHKFFTHRNNHKIPLSQATLEEDGSINIDGERIYSLR